MLRCYMYIYTQNLDLVQRKFKKFKYNLKLNVDLNKTYEKLMTINIYN